MSALPGRTGIWILVIEPALEILGQLLGIPVIGFDPLTGFPRNERQNDDIGHHGMLDKGVNLLQKSFTLTRIAKEVREVLDAPDRCD